jgi:aspartate/methionine/tyrosine aminotransferase
MPELLEVLKQKYNEDKIVITNGAKQALAASFYALRKLGFTKVATNTPYWLSFPTLAEKENLKFCPNDISYYKDTITLITSPNNPDGNTYSLDELKYIQNYCKQFYTALIFDGAYNSDIYYKNQEEVINIGDLQIISYSKYYGISGLRVGAIICRNPTLYKYLVEFMEITTTGVSTASQTVVLELEKVMKNNVKRDFVEFCRKDLNLNRQLLKNLVGNGILVPENGMFALLPEVWYRKMVENKIKVTKGEFFGAPNTIRISLGLLPYEFREAIVRLENGKA